MMHEESNDTATLAKSPFGMIQRCRCDAYSLTMGQIQLHLSAEQFAGISDLFNTAANKQLDFEWRASESGCRRSTPVIGPIKSAAEGYQEKVFRKEGGRSGHE